MYRSAGNPHVAAAKANIWSQSTQEVLNEWIPYNAEDAEKKERCQQELDSLDRRRGELVGGIDNPRRRNQDAKLIKADKNLVKRLHQIVVFNKTECDRIRRLEKRGDEFPPDHYMKGLPVPPVNETPPSPQYELEPSSPVQSLALHSPPPRSRFPLFRIFSRRKNVQRAPSPDVPRDMSFDDEPPPQQMAIANEAHNPPEVRAPESISSRAGQNNTYPGRHRDQRREAYDERIAPSPVKEPNSSSRHTEKNGEEYRDRRKEEHREHRRRDKYDDRDRHYSSSNRHDYDKSSRSRDLQPSSSQRRSDRDRPGYGDEYYSSRQRSSRRRHHSEDDTGRADPDRRRNRDRDRDRYKDKDYDRNRDRDHDRYRDRDRDRYRERDRGGREESSRPGRHRSEGDHKPRSGSVQPHRAPSQHSAERNLQEVEETPPPDPVPADGADVLSVSEQLHGSLNVGDS